MSDLASAVRSAQAALSAAGVASAEHDALALAAHALGCDLPEARRRIALGATIPDTYADLVTERAGRVPLQHLTGRAGFRRLELHVGPGVFVPRPETEVTAGHAIRAARDAIAAGHEHPVVVDLCAGSGAIALSVKREVPPATVHAVEKSPEAFAWAQRNRDVTGLDVVLSLGDAIRACPGLEEAVDVVVSNPPYIPLGQEPVDPEVRDHDPWVALYGGGADGLAIPLLVAGRAAELLRPGGTLVLEHGDRQGQVLAAALDAAGPWTRITDHEDLSGRPRVLVSIRTA